MVALRESPAKAPTPYLPPLAERLPTFAPGSAPVRLWEHDPALLTFPQYRPIELPADDAEIRVAERHWDRAGFVLTDEEFQHTLAMVLADDQVQLRRIPQADLEAEAEYLERTVAELRADRSESGVIFWVAVRAQYERRISRMLGELSRRQRYEASVAHHAPRRVPDGFVARLKREWNLHEAMTSLFPHIGTRRMANNYLALCPYHSEHTPSMVIYADHFHCFGCGQSGDVIDLMQQVEGGSWVDAVLRVAERLRIPIPDPAPARTGLGAL